MIVTTRRCVLGLLGAVFLASTAYAQSETAPRGSAAFIGGLASTSAATGVMLGGSMLFDLGEHLGLEGEATYLDRGTGADGFSASGSLLLNLLSSRGRIVPYAAIGGGVYRASFAVEDTDLMGPFASPPASYWGMRGIPEFYGRRMESVMDRMMWGRNSFTDPAASIGGGLRFNVSNRIMVRPDVRARLIFADGDTHAMAVMAFNVGYRF